MITKTREDYLADYENLCVRLLNSSCGDYKEVVNRFCKGITEGLEGGHLLSIQVLVIHDPSLPECRQHNPTLHDLTYEATWFLARQICQRLDNDGYAVACVFTASVGSVLRACDVSAKIKIWLEEFPV
jgi:hypothetical protein